MEFRGWQLGTGSVVGGKFNQDIGPDGEYERETVVTIYLTESNNFVIHEHRAKNFGDLQNDDVTVIPRKEDSDSTVVDLEGKPRKASDIDAEHRLLLELRRMGMGQASRDAWNEACKLYSPLRALETERLA